MKKLKLDLQGLNAEVLTRSQLKQILGGDGSGGTGGGSGGTACTSKSDCAAGQGCFGLPGKAKYCTIVREAQLA